MGKEFSEPLSNQSFQDEKSVEAFKSSGEREREYLDLRQENFEEHEKWQKNLKEVVTAMRQKRDALDEVVKGMRQKRAGRESIRTLIMVMGGGMQGAYAAGQLRALQVMGYTSRNVTEKDAMLGISVGAPMCAFVLAGLSQGQMGMSYFYTVCVTKEFINFLRLHKAIDVSVLTNNLRQGPLKINQEAIRKHPCRFYVQVYNQTKKQPEFINAKDPGLDMIETIHASVAIPVIYDKAVVLNDCVYSDGGFDDPLPIARAVEKFQPTHVLILPNRPFSRLGTGPIEKFAAYAMPAKGVFKLLKKLLTNRQSLRESLEFISKAKNVKIGIAWPPDAGLNQFSRDTAKIKSAIKVSGQEIFRLYGEPDRFIKLYEEEYGALPWLQTAPA